MTDPNRRVHAVLSGVAEVVRYDRQGRWYLESIHAKNRAVRIGEAVTLAVDLVNRGGRVYLGLPGGTAFDRKYRKALNSNEKGLTPPCST